MTGNFDILVYVPSDHDWGWMGEDSKQLEKVLLVGKYKTEWYCIIDIRYPLFDLYKDHG